MTVAQPTLELDGVSRFYGSSIALDRVTCAVGPGEVLFVLGANGAGKSTLLALAAGVLAPSEGDIRIRGRSGRRRDREQRAAVGYVSERPMLYGDLLLEEALLLVAKAGSSPRRVSELIHELELGTHALKRVRECSQGVLRRASFARALLLSPSVWLLDEPFTHLDVRSQERTLDLLKSELARGCGMLIASHEEALLRALPGKVLFLDRGRRRQEVTDVPSAFAALRRP